jgi:hypothetical protein
MSFSADCGNPEPMLASCGNLRSGLLVGSNNETVAGDGDVGKTKYLNRSRGTRFFDRVSLIVDDCADATPRSTGNEWIANAQRSVLHEHRGHWTSTNIEI